MSQVQNWYKADLRDSKFLIFEQFGLDEIIGKGSFANWGHEDVEVVLEGVYKWATERLGPLNRVGDLQGCRLENGRVSTPEGFREAWQEMHELGWGLLGVRERFGGQEGPGTLRIAGSEFMLGANVAFSLYPGLASGVARVVETVGTKEQADKFCKNLYSGVWGGTMCLTESHAGSDVGANSTKATKVEGNLYKIEGSKIYITAGDHDMTDNIIHLVLARTEHATAGSKGLSLFLVPRECLDGSGFNHVVTASLEKKMGLNGSATAVLNFGEDGDCLGELVGTQEEQGIRQMFLMMSRARIEVGVQSLALAGASYAVALDYAKTRKQGPSIKNWKDPQAPKVPIIQHPDVRRMLIDMKAKVEGLRALVFKLTTHEDHEELACGKDDAAARYHRGQIKLLVPVVKAYGSDVAYEVASTGLQVLGGAGYLKDFPLEQYVRDTKICSIYEGTNHIQALDLVARKLGQRGGAHLQAYLKDVNTFVAKYKEHALFGESVRELAKAVEAVGECALQFLSWSQGDHFELVPLNANRFLEMMGVTTVGWLLLEGAVIAQEKAAALTDDHPDKAFYAGKKHAAIYYARNIVPQVSFSAKIIKAADRSALDIPEEAFASF